MGKYFRLDRHNFIAIIILVGTFLRFFQISKLDFWYDEIFTIKTSLPHSQPEEFFLYNHLIRFVGSLSNYSEFSLRMISAIFSILTIILIFKIGKLMFDKKTAILASIITALSPFQIWYAQEARVYAVSTFMSTLSFYFFWKTFYTKSKKQKRIMLFYILTNIIGLYSSHPFFLIMLSVQFTLIIFKKPRAISSIIITLSAISMPIYLKTIISKMRSYHAGHFWVQQPKFPLSLLYTIDDIFIGYNGTKTIYLIFNMLIASVALMFILQLVYDRQRKRVRSLLILLYIFAFPLLFVFLFSRIFFPIYITRCFIIFSPYIYIWVSDLLMNKKKTHIPLAKIALPIILVSLLILSLNRYYNNLLPPYIPKKPNHTEGIHLKKPIRPLVRFVLNNLRNDDTICFTHPLPFPPFEFYYNIYTKHLPSYTIPNTYYVFSPDILYSPTRRQLKENKLFKDINNIKDLVKRKKFKRIFFIGCNWGRNGKLGPNSLKVKSKLDELYREVLRKDFDGIALIVYRVIS